MKIIEFIKLFFKSFKFAIQYSYQVVFNKGYNKSPYSNVTISITRSPLEKYEYFIFDKSNPIMEITRTPMKWLADLNYKDWLKRGYRKEDLVYIKVEDMEVE